MWFGFLIFSLCMEKQIPEIQAREILISYEGYNNKILEWKRRLQEIRNIPK